MLYLLKMCLLLPLLCVQCIMSKIPLYVYNVHCLQVNSMYTMYIIYKLTGRNLSLRLIFAISETYNVWFAARNIRDKQGSCKPHEYFSNANKSCQFRSQFCEIIDETTHNAVSFRQLQR